MDTKIKKVINIIKKYDCLKNNSDWSYIETNLITSIRNNQPIILISFTCSTINSEYMFDSKNPEFYVSLDPKGNNLEDDLPRLQQLYSELSQLYPVKIVILIGNTDPFYIYTLEGKFFDYTKEELLKRFNSRWSIYKKNLIGSLKKSYPTMPIAVISWYDLEREWEGFGWDFKTQFGQTQKNLLKLYPQSDLDWELRKLKEAFGPDKYFEKLPKPSINMLKAWIKRKFAQYTVQGLWIKQIFPTGILLQNEKPSLLRTKMYQPLIERRLNSRLPIIYPYGIDNTGYQ